MWLFPKGGIEDDESAKQAATRETCEEGGVIGNLGPKLGSWKFMRSSKQSQKMWILFVTTEYESDSKQWKERKKRLRAWHTFAEARQVLTCIPEETQRPELLDMLASAEQVVSEIGNGVVPHSLQTAGEAQDSDDEVEA